MSFFKDLKEDIAQSVSELTETLDDGLAAGMELNGAEAADSQSAQQDAVTEDYSEKMPEPAEIFAEDMEDLQSLDGAAEIELKAEPEMAAAEVELKAEPEMAAAEIELPAMEMEPEVEIEEPVMGELEPEDNEEAEEDMIMSEEYKEEAVVAEPADVAEVEEDNSQEVTVITKGTTITGGIKSDTSLVVKGTIEGDVECDGKLTITGRVAGNTIASEIYVNTPRLEGDINSKGIVKIDVGTVVIGNVNCTSVVVAGAVKGDIEVNGPVVIDSTAVVKGDVKAKSIQINSGAVIDGHCSLQFADVDLDSFFE